MITVRLESQAPGETGTTTMYARTLENGGLPKEARVLALKLTKRKVLNDTAGNEHHGKYLPIDFSKSEAEFGCTKELLEEAVNELLAEERIIVRSANTTQSGRKARRFVLTVELA